VTIVISGSRVQPIDALTAFQVIEIKLQYPLFAHGEFQNDGDLGFQVFPEVVPVRCQKQSSGKLIRNRAGAEFDFPRPGVFFPGCPDGLPFKAPMFIEIRVFQIQNHLLGGSGDSRKRTKISLMPVILSD